MSDINPSNIFKNNLTGEWENFSDPLHNFEFYQKNATNGSKSNEDTVDSDSHSDAEENKELFPPKTNKYSMGMSDDPNLFQDFPASTTDEFVVVGNDRMPAYSEQSRKHNVIDKLEKTSFINRVRSPKMPVPSDVSVKYAADKQNVSPNSKKKNSSSFSMFGQLLNKKQNNSPPSRSLGSSSNFSLSMNMQKSSPTLESKCDSSETNDGMQKAQMKTKLRSMWNNVKYGKYFVYMITFYSKSCENSQLQLNFI